MRIVPDKEAKAERLEVRLTPSNKALLAHAAQARQTTITEFLISSAVRAAEEVVASPKVFFANDEGWTALQRLLDDEAYQPGAGALARLGKHQRKR
jgi:uncharacterized protein (DUF1778 family)